MLPDPADAMAAYTGLQARLSELLADVPDARAAALRVPGCPEWSVTGASAHVYGVCVDILDGNIAAAGQKDWADRHVERFAPLGLATIVEQWGEIAPQITAIGPAFPPQAAAQFVFDATTHEHDIRGALDRPGARDADSVLVALSFLEASLDGHVRAHGLPTLAITSPDWSMVAGDGEPEVEVEGSTFELFRSFGGRRSVEQFRALAWSGSPDLYLTVLDGDRAISLRDTDLIE